MQTPTPRPVTEQPQGATRRRLVIALAAAAAVIVVIGVFLPLLNAWGGIPPSRLRAVSLTVAQQFYPNAEGNLWAWYSSLMLALLGIVFVAIAVLVRRAGGRGGAYGFMGAVALALSIDESTQIHEQFGLVTAELGWSLPYAYDWILIGIPIALVVGAALLWAARRIDRVLRIRLIVAGALYFLGAVGMETATGAIEESADLTTDFGAALAHEVVMGLEESLEFAGVLVAFAAVLAMFDVAQTDRGLVVGVRGDREPRETTPPSA